LALAADAVTSLSIVHMMWKVAIEFDRIAINREAAKEKVTTSTASCTRGGEIRHVGLDVEYHV
jgi:hypothetical protein